jgi:hypothetical protein
MWLLFDQWFGLLFLLEEALSKLLYPCCLLTELLVQWLKGPLVLACDFLNRLRLIDNRSIIN